MSDFRQDFLKFALAQNVLKFGEFTTKAGVSRLIFSMPVCSMTAHRLCNWRSFTPRPLLPAA